MNMYNLLEVHSVIQFFTARGEKVAEITRMLKETYGEHCCNESTVKPAIHYSRT